MNCQAATITNLLNGATLNSANSWAGGIVPGADDIVCFVSTDVATNLTWTITEDTAWSGIQVDYGASIYFRRSNNAKLHLGKNGIQQTIGNIHFNIPVHLQHDQTWDCRRGLTFYSTFNTFLNGHVLTIAGTTSTDYPKNFSESVIGPGTIVNGGLTSFAANKGALDTDLIVEAGTLRFYNSSPTNRAKSVEIQNSATLLSSCTLTTPSITEIEGNITINGDVPQMSFWKSAASSSTILANRFDPVSGMAIIRGTAIGEYPIDYMGDAVARVNVLFRETPEMLGNPFGTGVETPIVKDVILHRTTSSSTYGEGFSTYDPMYGLRLLDPATEYAHTIVDGQTELSNVLFTNTLAGPVEITLTEPLTTINSLSINLAGVSGAAGVSILGEPDTTLRLDSGMMFIQHNLAATRTTDDNQTIAVPNLDFNGHDGKIFLGMMIGNSNGSLTPAFNLQSSFTNVSENGVSFYSPTAAYLYMNGDVPNTYKGTITLNSGVWARFARTPANTAVLGTLILNGGSCQVNHQIADDAHVTINSGTLMVKSGATNSGNGGADSFGSLTLNGGTFSLGGDGGGGVSTISNIWIHGGAVSQYRSTSLDVPENLMISGGQMTVRSNSDSSRSGSTVRVFGATTISNTFDNVEFVPIVLGYSYYRLPCAIALLGDFTFVGNTVNTNTAKITITESTDPKTMLGQVQLEGEIPFNIIDGAADVDLDIQAILANSTNAGMLVKRGEGMLLLSVSTNTLTGGIRIEQGTLGITGLLNSQTARVTVQSGATFQSYTTTQLDGGLELEDGANLRIDVNGVLKASSITGADATVWVDFVPTEEMLEAKSSVILSDSKIEPNLVSAVNNYWIYRRNNGKEVWIGKPPSTLLLVR